MKICNFLPSTFLFPLAKVLIFFLKIRLLREIKLAIFTEKNPLEVRGNGYLIREARRSRSEKLDCIRETV